MEENRGGARGKKRKLGGDSGKGFLKLTLTLYDDDESVDEERPAKKKRRTREDRIGTSAEETGQNMILLLGVVPTIPESSFNIQKMIEAIGINEFPYMVTGDLKFLMPCFGLKGCSSLHPCLLCSKMRRKGEWLEGGNLRTFGNLEEQLQKLPDGAQQRGHLPTDVTARTESVVGPVLVRCPADDDDHKTVLAKVGPPTVHLLLAVNDIINKCAKYFGDRKGMLAILRTEVGVVPHSYQGREGALAGPECSKILDQLHILQPHLEKSGEEGISLLDLLRSFQRVKKDIFGTKLGEMWESSLEQFAADLNIAHTTGGLPISPKLHIIQTHLIEFVNIFGGQALGRLNETAVEAVHGTFLKLWHMYVVNDEQSPAYLENLLRCVRANADNSRQSS